MHAYNCNSQPQEEVYIPRGTKEIRGKEEQRNFVAKRNEGTSWQIGTRPPCGKVPLNSRSSTIRGTG